MKSWTIMTKNPIAALACLLAFATLQIAVAQVVKNESSNANGEMRFACASKYGGNYTLRITIRKDPSGTLWLDASASAE